VTENTTLALKLISDSLGPPIGLHGSDKQRIV
jgi:hypothetical protein